MARIITRLTGDDDDWLPLSDEDWLSNKFPSWDATLFGQCAAISYQGAFAFAACMVERSLAALVVAPHLDQNAEVRYREGCDAIWDATVDPSPRHEARLRAATEFACRRRIEIDDLPSTMELILTASANDVFHRAVQAPRYMLRGPAFAAAMEARRGTIRLAGQRLGQGGEVPSAGDEEELQRYLLGEICRAAQVGLWTPERVASLQRLARGLPGLFGFAARVNLSR